MTIQLGWMRMVMMMTMMTMMMMMMMMNVSGGVEDRKISLFLMEEAKGG